MSRASLAMMAVLASVGCGPNPWDALLALPVCDTLDTDAECKDLAKGSSSSSSGTFGPGIMTTTSDESSSTQSGSDGGSGTTAGAMSTSATGSTSTGDTGTGEPVCGDGVVEGDEECEGSERCFECLRDRWIFASAALHNGDLGGIEGANSLCRQYALQSQAADHNWKTFIAWLSDADHDMRDRLPPTIRGRYVRTDGQVVAETVDDLFSGMLVAPIELDEHGEMAWGYGVVTGTQPDGTAAPGTHCDNWTSSSIFDNSLYGGLPSEVDGWWTMVVDPKTSPTDCLIKDWRLYCLEGA